MICLNCFEEYEETADCKCPVCGAKYDLMGNDIDLSNDGDYMEFIDEVYEPLDDDDKMELLTRIFTTGDGK